MTNYIKSTLTIFIVFSSLEAFSQNNDGSKGNFGVIAKHLEVLDVNYDSSLDKL